MPSPNVIYLGDRVTGKGRAQVCARSPEGGAQLVTVKDALVVGVGDRVLIELPHYARNPYSVRFADVERIPR